MSTTNLKQLLENYNKNLCNKVFKYTVFNKTKNNTDILIIRFYKENLCHLLGLQHVYNDSKKFLGESGYKLIYNQKVTVKSLKEHNKDGYNFIKIKLKHFDEIYDIIKNGKLIYFDKYKCHPRTYISADFMLIKDNTTYILHLFLRKETDNTDNYSPVSFIIHTNKDKHYHQYINKQTPKKILSFEEITLR